MQRVFLKKFNPLKLVYSIFIILILPLQVFAEEHNKVLEVVKDHVDPVGIRNWFDLDNLTFEQRFFLVLGALGMSIFSIGLWIFSKHSMNWESNLFLIFVLLIIGSLVLIYFKPELLSTFLTNIKDFISGDSAEIVFNNSTGVLS